MVAEPVEAPLPHVPVHVVEAPGVRAVAPHRRVLVAFATVQPIPSHLVHFRAL